MHAGGVPQQRWHRPADSENKVNEATGCPGQSSTSISDAVTADQIHGIHHANLTGLHAKEREGENKREKERAESKRGKREYKRARVREVTHCCIT